MTQTLNDTLIAGTLDTTQLTVRGNATQNYPLQEWQTSVGADVARLTADGRLQIGTSFSGAPDALIQAAYTPSGTQPLSVWHAPGTITNAGTPVNWVYHELQLAGTAAISTLQNGLYTKLTHGNTGAGTAAELRAATFQSLNQTGVAGTAIGQLTGLRAVASNGGTAYLGSAAAVEAQVTNDTGGSVSTAIAFSVVAPITPAGRIDNLYGLKVPALTQGTVSNYAIYTDTGAVHLGDYLETKVQASTPTGNPPSNFIKLYPKLVVTTPHLYAKDSGGTEYDLSGSGAGSSVDVYEAGVSVVTATTRLDFKDFNVESVSGSIAAVYHNLPFVNNGRLTLSSGTAIPAIDIAGTAGTAVYLTPYQGNLISLYDGTRWKVYSFSEQTTPVPATTLTPFDVFAYDNGGTVTLETVNWTNNTTRATALTTQDSVYVKSGAATRRYLGTGYTTSTSGRCEDSVTKRFLWNYYNRVSRPMRKTDSTGSWTYNTTSWRAANNSTSNRVEVVVGVAEALLHMSSYAPAETSATGEFATGIGEDSTSSIGSDVIGRTGESNNNYSLATSVLDKLPAAGYHYYQWCEYGSGVTTTWHGIGNSTRDNVGISGWIEA
jgi:hypothetical protein